VLDVLFRYMTGGGEAAVGCTGLSLFEHSDSVDLPERFAIPNSPTATNSTPSTLDKLGASVVSAASTVESMLPNFLKESVPGNFIRESWPIRDSWSIFSDPPGAPTDKEKLIPRRNYKSAESKGLGKEMMASLVDKVEVINVDHHFDLSVHSCYRYKFHLFAK